MAKTSSSKNSSRSSSNRPKPMAPRAGVTATRRRYGAGGKTSN